MGIYSEMKKFKEYNERPVERFVQVLFENNDIYLNVQNLTQYEIMESVTVLLAKLIKDHPDGMTRDEIIKTIVYNVDNDYLDNLE